MSFKKNFKIAQSPLTLSLSPWGRGQGEGIKGQALTELALFGSVFLLVLGVMVNYGLRSYYQEKASQDSFRNAMDQARHQPESGYPSSSSHMLVEDSNIPDPANPYGIGTISPFFGSASVTRNYKLGEVPGWNQTGALPVLQIDDSDTDSLQLASAGFRIEHNVSCSAKEKYKEIYGASNLYDIWKEKDDEVKEIDCPKGSDKFTQFRILDSSSGEIIDYDSTIRQCRQIIDTVACETECMRGRKEYWECPGVCAAKMNPPNQVNSGYDSSRGGAWYCADYEAHPDGQPHHYRFPVLDELFGIKEEDYHSKDDQGNDIVIKPKPRPMGLQTEGFTIKTQMDNKIVHKPDPRDGARTTWNSHYRTIRKALYHDMDTTTPELKSEPMESDALGGRNNNGFKDQ